MRRFRMLSAALCAAVLLGGGRPLAQAPAGARASAQFEVAVAKNVMVPMRDGVRLATDVYLPARNGATITEKFPVLLTRTPYGKNGQDTSARFLASHGYVVIVQDVRGRYESEGTFYIYAAEAKDGYDAIEWAATQPWSNGRIGTFGGSYSAGTQNAAALEKPPHLAAEFITVGTSNYYQDGAGRAGAAYLLHNLAYALNLGSTSKEAQANPAIEAALKRAAGPELGAWMRAYPPRPNASPLQAAPAYQRWFQDFIDHPDYDDYWKQTSFTFERYYDRYPDVPIYFVGGWYDIFLHGTLANFAGLSKQSTPKKLLIGPWVHGVGPATSGDVFFGSSAAVSIPNEQIRWFDEVLKGVKTGVLDEPRVKLFVMGGGSGARTMDGHLTHGGEWRTYASWPPAGTSARQEYLHADGTLSETKPGASTPSGFTFDPSSPIPTIGGQIDSGKELVPNGPFDQRCAPRIFGCSDTLPLSARRDILVFQTPPLDHDTEVTGPISVNLWVSSSAPDTDITAKLVDVYPPSVDYPAGYDLNIADRIVRLRYSRSVEKPALLENGEIRAITVDLLATSNRFRKGHRIRLDISSSNFPFFDVNPNTGEPLGRHTHQQPAVNRIYHDPEHPSHLVLTIAPAERVSAR